MKIFLKLIFLLLFSLIILSFNQEFINIKNIKTFKVINYSEKVISKKLISDYFSNDDEVKKEAKSEIKKIVLKDIGYDNWLSYLKYIKIIIYPIDILGDSNEDIIVALNISKDIGAISIYKSKDNYYVYSNKIEDLTYIRNISSIGDKSLDSIFILTDEILDEKVGAFFYDDFLRVFVNINSRYKEVFRQSKDYVSYFYEDWVSPSLENPKWYKLTEKNLIDYHIDDNNKVIFNVSKTLTKFEAYNSQSEMIPKNFKLIIKKNFDLTYYWNDEYNYFIQSKGKIKSTGEIVGIIENSKQNVDSLLCLTNDYFKIIDNNGKIKFIKEDNLVILQ